MNNVQHKILEIVEYFDRFCNNHNINYFLMGGSALGAIRHKGFIPWDDDFDVFMLPSDYYSFIEACESKLDSQRFYLQRERTDEWPLYFSKLRMNGTTFIEKDTIDRVMHKGFYIDIMCLNFTTKNLVVRYLQYFSARLLTVATLNARGYKTDNLLKKVVLKILSPLITNSVQNFLLKIVQVFNRRTTSYLGHFFGRAKFANTCFPKTLIGNGRKVRFENLYLPVLDNVESYLEIRYGREFMKMPSKKTRDMYPNHFIYANPDMDYKSFKKESLE